MKYTGPVYCPPFEDGSLLLQATVGCSHNSCAFCSMYKGVPFQVESMERIEQDLLETREKRPWYKQGERVRKTEPRFGIDKTLKARR